MEEKDLTKKVLAKVAKELNKVMELEPEIQFDHKRTNDKIKKDLIEAGAELNENDEISGESKEALEALGVKLPWDKKEVEKEKEKEKPPIKKAGGKNEPGIIASILEFISASEGIQISKIHEKLIARFADRDSKAMLKTIKAQIGGKKRPCRMEREKKVTFNIVDGKYSVKK
jgi:hypothetical protein